MRFFVASACDDPSNQAGGYVDKPRLRAEAEAAIRPWLQYAPDGSGFFRTQFDRIWQPLDGNGKVSLVGLSRLLYIFAAGYDLTGDLRFREAVRSGGRFLLDKMRNPASGGWYNTVDSQGQPVHKGAHPYGYSFVVFGLSHAYRLIGDEDFLQAALDTWRSGVWHGLSTARSHAGRGYADVGSSDTKPSWTQNPYMHLFEALLALHDVTGSAEVWSDIEDMARFLKERLIHSTGCMPEWFDTLTFSPLDDTGKGFVELGHQVEWAYFLSRVVERGLDERYRGVAERLMDFAIDHGLDRKTGGLRGRSDYSGQNFSGRKQWWAQAELMRAAVHFATRHGRDDLWPIYRKAQDFARIHYVDQEYGGWTRDSFVDSGKSSRELKKTIGYHVVGFYMEALSIMRSPSTN